MAKVTSILHAVALLALAQVGTTSCGESSSDSEPPADASSAIADDTTASDSEQAHSNDIMSIEGSTFQVDSGSSYTENTDRDPSNGNIPTAGMSCSAQFCDGGPSIDEVQSEADASAFTAVTDGGLPPEPDGMAPNDCDADCVEGPSPEPVCGNGVQEIGELCDPCPVTCDDENVCTTDTLVGTACNAKCTSSPVTICVDDGCCPEECNANNDVDCLPTCANGTQELQENCGSCPADAPCDMSGFTCFAGECTQCGGNGEPCCALGSECESGICEVTNGICQPPPGLTLLWSENFESFSWDQVGQGTLPNGIDVWDVDGILRTLTGSGATGNGLTWWGGSSSAVASSATMTLPPVVQAGRNATVHFKAYFALLGSIQIAVGRSVCPSTTIEVVSGNWELRTVSLPNCDSSGRIVFQLGNLYNIETGSQALKFDDIEVYYLD